MASQNNEAARIRLPILQQEKSYKHWRNAILMWSVVTDVEPEKQALVVALHLRGRARELALNIDSAELNTKTGLATLLNLLDERIQGLDTYRTFQKLDNLRKSWLQSMCHYVDSFEIFYESAAALGSFIPDKILAYKLLNGSGLSQERQEKILETTEVISVAGIRAALLPAGNWSRTKAFPETTANGSKQLQAICTQPNQSQQLRTQASSLSNTSSKFSFTGSNGQTNVASADSTVKVMELTASASTKDNNKNVFSGFSFPATTSLKNSSNGKQEVKFPSNPCSSLKSSLKKTNESALETKIPASQTGSNSFLGISSQQSPTRTLSFANSSKSLTTVTPSTDTSATDKTKQSLVTGSLKVDKKRGKWNCSDCYTENEPTDVVCPCCGKANPNAPAAPKAESSSMKSGLISLGLNRNTPFSFGSQPTTSNSVVRIGEEGEDALFSERSKLYRWHEGQWKDKGVGTMKVLRHKITGKYMLLMRIDISLKICCNHVIEKSLNLQPMPNTDKAWSWYAMDFSEEKGKQEGLAIRFKTPEIANEFKAKFAEGQQANAAIGGVSSATHDDDDVVFVSELVPTDDQKKRAEKLLLPATFFLHENNPLLPDFDEKIEDEEDKILKFIKDRDSGKLKLKEKTTTTATTTKTTAESSGFGDTIKTNTTKLADSSSNKEGWVFGGATQSAATFSSVGAASLGSLSSGVQNVGFTKDLSFQFPGAGKVMFASQTTEGDDHHDPANFKCEAQFKPVLEELPPLIEVKTGEEGEEIVFKERCKLYRYDKDVKAWKEKGVGEIKILRNDEYKLYRVVMRRDQVLKVCTNHVINETTNPEPHLGSTKSCSYFVMDYSESKIPIPEKIAIRFKLDELCKTYMDKIAEIKHLQEPQS